MYNRTLEERLFGHVEHYVSIHHRWDDDAEWIEILELLSRMVSIEKSSGVFGGPLSRGS